MSEDLPREIRCVLVSTGGPPLLLPNAAIAEVIALPAVEPPAGAHPWLLGRIAWRGRKLPLLSYARLVGGEEDEEEGVRGVVLKATGRLPELPFLALPIRGFPRLITLNAELIVPTHDDALLPPGMRMRVLVREHAAVIPDLEFIERALSEVRL